jgi:hypothetical protein
MSKEKLAKELRNLNFRSPGCYTPSDVPLKEIIQHVESLGLMNEFLSLSILELLDYVDFGTNVIEKWEIIYGVAEIEKETQ